MLIFGIDPGLNGAVAILEKNNIIDIFDMPTMAQGNKNKRQLNCALLSKIFQKHIHSKNEISVVVEKVNACSRGDHKMFNFGQSLELKGIWVALELPIFL